MKRGRFYVYALCYPDGRAFYIGKGQRDRMVHHERDARNGVQNHKCNTIRKIWRDGGAVSKRVLFETDDEAEAYVEEIRQIALHGGVARLTNQKKGGGLATHLNTDQEIDILLRTCRCCTDETARFVAEHGSV